jgi:hypothetical protein
MRILLADDLDVFDFCTRFSVALKQPLCHRAERGQA